MCAGFPGPKRSRRDIFYKFPLSGAVTCKTNRCPKTFLKRLSLDTGIVDLFSLKDLHFFHLLNPPDACHCTSYPSLDAEPRDRGKDQDSAVEVNFSSCVMSLNKTPPHSTKLTKSMPFILRPDACSYQSLMRVFVLRVGQGMVKKIEEK